MFSENKKISIGQINRLLILDIFGVSSLLLPGLLANSVGKDGIFSMITAAGFAVFYVWLLGKILKQIQGSYYTFLKEQLGEWIGDFVMIFYLFFFLLMGAFLLYLLGGMIRTWLLPQGSYQGIYGLLLLLAGYGSYKGIETRARIYEILFWFLGIPLFLMLFLAAKDVQTDYWTPIVSSGFLEFGKGTLYAILFFLPLGFLCFLKPHCNHSEKMCSGARKVILIVTLLNIAVYLILLGNFQVNTTAVLKYPIITLMSMIKFPGGFVERLDTFMTAIWFFSVFALLNTGVYYSSSILKELFREKKTQYGLFVVLIVEFFMARWFLIYPQGISIYFSYLVYLGLPFMVLLPLLLYISTRFGKKKGVSCEK